jgi:hypothetical protein
MSKVSIATRLISIAILMALMLAAFPATSAIAITNDQGLATKWDQLVSSYNRQSITHNSAHHWAEVWLMKNKDASAADKTEIQRHLNICNSALATATAVVTKHEGFNAKGEVVDKAAAKNSIQKLNQALLLHAASIRHLKGHVN